VHIASDDAVSTIYDFSFLGLGVEQLNIFFVLNICIHALEESV
jgi:hypothetical protein